MSSVTTALRRRRLSRLRLHVTRQRVRLGIAAGVVLAILLGGGWLLVRDSSLVSVEHVTVTGADGPDGAAIRAALERGALKMTTLDIQMNRLLRSVARFPEVKGLRVSADFPHGLVIHVVELAPVAVVERFGRILPVTGDGRILSRTPALGGVPLIDLGGPARGRRLEEPWALGAVRVLAAAPSGLLRRLTDVKNVAGRGLMLQIRNGPSLYFGSAEEPRAKWLAVLAVLADSGSAGASYIDVTDPARPAAGVDSGGASGSATGSAAAGGTASGTPGSATGASGSATPGSATGAPGSATGAPGSATGAGPGVAPTTTAAAPAAPTPAAPSTTSPGG